MKNAIKAITIILTVISILISLTYIVLLMFSGFLPGVINVEDNYLFADWLFMAIPILGFLTGIFLQVISVHKKKKKS